MSLRRLNAVAGHGVLNEFPLLPIALAICPAAIGGASIVATQRQGVAAVAHRGRPVVAGRSRRRVEVERLGCAAVADREGLVYDTLRVPGLAWPVLEDVESPRSHRRECPHGPEVVPGVAVREGKVAAASACWPRRWLPAAMAMLPGPPKPASATAPTPLATAMLPGSAVVAQVPPPPLVNVWPLIDTQPALAVPAPLSAATASEPDAAAPSSNPPASLLFEVDLCLPIIVCLPVHGIVDGQQTAHHATFALASNTANSLPPGAVRPTPRGRRSSPSSTVAAPAAPQY